MVAQSRVSGKLPVLGGAFLCLVLWCVGFVPGSGAGLADAAPKLVAPVYPGAVPAVTGKPSDGRPVDCEARCFLTKDPIDKVKAFYEKHVGPMKAGAQPYGQRSYGVLLEMRQVMDGTMLAGVGIHALGPPLKGPTNPQHWKQAYLTGALWWNGAGGPIHLLAQSTDWDRTGDRNFYPYKPEDLVALYAKYSRAQSNFFVLDLARGKNRAALLDEQVSEQAAQLQTQSLMGNLAAQTAIARDSNREGDRISAGDVQDDPEFNRIMGRKPALQKRYVALAQKTQQLMMAGKEAEAEAAMDEADRVLRSDPEMAALMKRYDARDQQRETVAASSQQRSDAATVDSFRQLADRRWSMAVQTLDTLMKEGYSTFIVVDEALAGNDVNRNRAELNAKFNGLLDPPGDLGRQANSYTLAKETAGVVVEGPTPQQVAAGQGAGASSPAAQAPTAAGSQQPAQQPKAAEAPAPAKPNVADQAAEAAKKGLKALKKLF